MTLPAVCTAEEYRQADAIISRGLASFVETGNALLFVQQTRGYRFDKFDTFEDYCANRHDMSRSRAYQLQDAARVVGALSTIVDKPKNEGQAREFVPLLPASDYGPPPEWRPDDLGPLREVAEFVYIENDEKPTAKIIRHWVRAKLAEIRPELEPPPIPVGIFRTIVADPPWPIEKIEREERPNQHTIDYPTMSVQQICDLAPEIMSRTDDGGAHLYLWTTHKHLPDALRVADAWGFKYQCLLTWVKNVGFTPFSWMYSTEHVLFCRSRKGSLDLLRNGLRLDFAAPVTRHSEKPDAFFELVEQASPGPRLELFARKRRDGWEAWGNDPNLAAG